MYLVSIYFDKSTDTRIQYYINQIAKKTGNQFMLEHQVPPHITLSSFETKQEERAVQILKNLIPQLSSGMVTWASTGVFFPSVLYLAPVLNSYLHNLSFQTYDALQSIEDIRFRPYYQPFQWIPHTTIGKNLSKEEMLIAFRMLQNEFGMFHGQVTEIGLAKTNPYQDMATYKLP